MIEHVRFDGQWRLMAMSRPYRIERFDAYFTADAAAGAGVKMALQFFEIRYCSGVQGDTDGILGLARRAFVSRVRWYGGLVSHQFRCRKNGVPGQDAFGEKEAKGQFQIVTRGAHGHGYGLFAAVAGRAIFQYDLQGLFHDYEVVGVVAVVRRDLLDGQTGDAG